MTSFDEYMRRLAAERGLSLRQLARIVRFDHAYLSRVANGRQAPSENLANALDEALDADGELARCRPASKRAVQRRDFLCASMTTAGLAVASPQLVYLSSGRRVNSTLVEALRQRAARLRCLDDLLGGADTYGLYAAELGATAALVDEASYTESVGRALLSVVAEQAQQAGWAAFDAGWHTTARRLFKESFSAASDAGDVSLLANSMAFLAYQKISTGQPGAEEAEASCRVAEEGIPPTVRALLLERAAWAHAVAGHSPESEHALALARDALGGDREPQGPDWAAWVDQTELQIMTGRCWTQLGKPAQAVPVLEAALATYADTHARDKALYLTWLAEAHLDSGEVEQAAIEAGRSLDLSADVASVRPQQRLAGVLRRLEHHGTLEPVAEVLERAASLPTPSFDPPT